MGDQPEAIMANNNGKLEYQPQLIMANTTAPHRMKMSHPNMFSPKLMFFLTSLETDDLKNWSDCFDMKAGAVYFSIFGKNATEKTINDARYLLKAIAYFIIKGEDNRKSDELKKEIEQEREDPDNKLTIDAVYLVVGFLHDINKTARKSTSYDRESLDKYCLSKHGPHVLSDIVMIDNQLRLDCVDKVVENLGKALALTKRHSKTLNTDISSLDKFELSFNNISQVASVFCSYYTPFYIDAKQFPSYKAPDHLSPDQKTLTLLEYLHHRIVPSAGTENGSSTANAWTLPNAKELWRNGVRLEASTDQQFTVEFKPPTLKLPVLFWDSKLETVLMNLVALECWRTTKPVSRYLQLLNELVEDEEDVRVLKKFGLVKGKWKKDEEVVSLVKRVDGFASYPSMFPSMDRALERVQKYYDDRKKKFLVRFGPRNSWVPYVAAATTVILTAVIASKRRGG